MLVLLDTNICIHLINRRPGFEAVLRRLSGRSFGEICISAITVSELSYGVAKSARSSENAATLDEFLSRFELLDYPVDAAASYGRIRADLERAGKPIGNNDLLIAAHALAIGARVATSNTSEFERVRGLKVLDWLA
jgi:tRNA(fMet)-specific endonuclease VapC